MARNSFKFSPDARQKIIDGIIRSISSDVSGGFDLNVEERVSQIEKIVGEDLSKISPKHRCSGHSSGGRPCGNIATDFVYDQFYCWVHNPRIAEERAKRNAEFGKSKKDIAT